MKGNHEPAAASRCKFTYCRRKVYNLCCKSAKAAKLFVREGMAESMAGLLDEMYSTDEESHYHPQAG